MLKIALTGLPGVGKSTASKLLLQTLMDRQINAEVIKLAAPLYDIQTAFYKRIETPLLEEQQDGQLLNFLGGHFRKVDPEFLGRDLAWRCSAAILSGARALICDDARPLDLETLHKQGFTIIRIVAPDDLRKARKTARGDKFSGDDNHPTERSPEGANWTADITINNDGGIDVFEQQILRILDTWENATASTLLDEKTSNENIVIQEMLAKAQTLISAHYAENRHQIAAAVLSSDGRIFTGLHIEAMVGRASVCAEAVALGKAREAGATDIRLALAVRHPKPSEIDKRVTLVPPCGLCRELLLDYGIHAKTAIEVAGEIKLFALNDMLPHKYKGTKWTY